MHPRILAFIRSDRSSSITRRPALRSCPATSLVKSKCRSAIGIKATWMGDSQTEKLPHKIRSNTPKKRSRLPSKALVKSCRAGEVDHLQRYRSGQTDREVKDKLEGGKLPFTANSILNFQINLRTIESATAFIHVIIDLSAF